MELLQWLDLSDLFIANWFYVWFTMFGCLWTYKRVLLHERLVSLPLFVLKACPARWWGCPVWSPYVRQGALQSESCLNSEFPKIDYWLMSWLELIPVRPQPWPRYHACWPYWALRLSWSALVCTLFNLDVWNHGALRNDCLALHYCLFGVCCELFDVTASINIAVLQHLS